MEKIRIKCPFCGAVLEAPDNPANYEKTVVCPNCKTKNKFKDFKRINGTLSGEDDVTEINRTTRDTVGSLMELKTSRCYPLKEGINLIGRMTVKTPSVADIPIETQDMGMSRAHLYMEVVKGRDGFYHTYVYNAKNKNTTLINGVVLEDGDKIGLKHNDVITLNETKLRFLGTRIDDGTII